MKKVSFMKLNLQQENLLSKEEKKEVLGGYGPSPCYARCNGSNNNIGVESCTAGSSVCSSTGVACCTCYQGPVC